MADDLKVKARNYFLLGIIAEKLDMQSEAATNFFKSLFAVDDWALTAKTGSKPKDHVERFHLLRSHLPDLYTITDKLFSTYRRTYTMELRKEEVHLVKKRVMEAFTYASIPIPTDEEIQAKFEEIHKKGKASD